MSEFETRYKQTLYGLSLIYCKLLEKSDADFMAEVVEPMLADDTLDIYPYFEAIAALPKPKMLPLDVVRLSCAYATTAYRAYKAREEGKAWESLCDAQYWYGMVDGSEMLPDLVDVVNKGQAESGGNAKNRARNIAREYARQLVLKSPDKYTSASHAANAVEKPTNDYMGSLYDEPGKREELGLKERPAFKASTMRKWFTDIYQKDEE